MAIPVEWLKIDDYYLDLSVYAKRDELDDYITQDDLNNYVTKSNLINSTYPVGSVMIRIDNTNPASLPLFRGTTWTKISEGRMLIGANSTYPLGRTGGQATHTHTTPARTLNGNSGSTTLTAGQSGMPAHTHTQVAHAHGGVNGAKFPMTFENLKFTPSKRQLPPVSTTGKYFVISDTNTNGIADQSNTASATPAINNAAAKNATSSHNHTINHTHPAATTGAGNNMPPWLAVNMWVRQS